MRIQKNIILFIIFTQFFLTHAQTGILPTLLFVSNVITWSIDFWHYTKTTHQTITSFAKNFGDNDGQDNKFIDGVTAKIFQGLSQVSNHLDEVSNLMNKRTRELKKIIKKFGLEIDINSRMDDLVQKMGTIDNIYDDLLRYSSEFDKKALCRFAYHQLYDYALSRDINAMYNIILPSRSLETSLLAEIYEDLENNKNELCGTGHSTLDYFHSIFISLMLVEIKAFAMTVFFHNLLFYNNGTNKHCEYLEKDADTGIMMAQKKFREHLEDYSRVFLEKMKDASIEFRACDQNEDFIRDETYYELEGAIQTIIQLQPTDEDSVGDSRFTEPCEDIKETYGTPDAYCNYEMQFCTTALARNCLGYTRKCYAPGDWIDGCVAKNSPRRYEWINWQETESARVLMENCTEYLLVPEFSKEPPSNPFHAIYLKLKKEYKPCLCECNDNDVDSLSTHIFNLQWVESDISKNMVITGIRFIIEHRIMQLQIQQGKLQSNFEIKEAHWKSINDISEEIRAIRLHKKLRGEFPKLVENKDYLIVNKGINNAINFDTLRVSYPHVLTGVRFYYAIEDKGGVGRIQIAIKGTEFNHITGELCQKCNPEIVMSQIHHKQRYHYPRRNVKNPEFPTVPITPPGQYVDIDVSDLMHDSGQTTLPYFDALPLVSKPPSPLGGLGIFHKGAGDFTGFVSLKFVSLNHLVYMKKSLDEAEQEDQEQLLQIPMKYSHSLRERLSSACPM